MNQNSEIIEVQGTAEEGSFTRTQLNSLLDCAEKGITQLQAAQREAIPQWGEVFVGK